MTDIKTFKAEFTVTIKKDVIYMMMEGGTYSRKDDEDRYGFGCAGAVFVVDLPGGLSATINARELIAAGLDAVEEEQ